MLLNFTCNVFLSKKKKKQQNFNKNGNQSVSCLYLPSIFKNLDEEHKPCALFGEDEELIVK